MATYYSPKITTNGLVFALDAANRKSYNSGSGTWYDLSNNGYNGTLTNGPTFSNANGGTILFDGVDDQIDCGDIDLLGGATSATWEVWFKPSSISQGSYWQSLLTTWNDPSSGVGHTWILDTRYASWSFYIRFNGDVGSYPAFSWDGGSGRNDFSSNNWYQMVGVFDSSLANAQKVKIYINGQYISSSDPGSVTSIANKNSNERLKIAVDRSSTAPFIGNIGVVRIYKNNGLTSSDVLQNYNATKNRFGL
jgi:hypothetical protein